MSSWRFPASTQIIGHQVDEIKNSRQLADLVGLVDCWLVSCHCGSQQKARYPALGCFLLKSCQYLLAKDCETLLVLWRRIPAISWIFPVKVKSIKVVLSQQTKEESVNYKMVRRTVEQASRLASAARPNSLESNDPLFPARDYASLIFTKI